MLLVLLACGRLDPYVGTPVPCPTWYRDADGDGQGDPNTTQVSCTEEDGWVAQAGDCDDANPEIPDDDEHCDVDDIDDDCDGLADDEDPDAPAPQTFCHDADGDGYGTPDDTINGCDPTTEYLEDCSDCDDTDAAISPAATDSPGDALDSDCDGIDGSTVEDPVWTFSPSGGWFTAAAGWSGPRSGGRRTSTPSTPSPPPSSPRTLRHSRPPPPR